MNNTECITILEFLTASYPYAHLTNADQTVGAWMLALGEYPGDIVGKAARLFVTRGGRFFPSPSEIVDVINRNFLTEQKAQVTKIEAPKVELNIREYMPEDYCSDIMACRTCNKADMCPFANWEL